MFQAPARSTAFALTMFLLAACAGTEAYDPSDLDGADDRSDQGGSFQPSHLISNAAFFDAEAMSEQGVQEFLENTPYGFASGLASYEVAEGTLASHAIMEAAMAANVNPLIILVKLQKEAGLISKRQATGLSAAMGCACPDNRSCSRSSSGLQNQLDCFVELIQRDSDLLASTGKTLTGWGPRVARKTLDNISISPANDATAILYTYTPWVLRGTGGNWLFWNVWQRYAQHVSYQGLSFPFNEGFIGAQCLTEADCQYEGGLCEQGTCTMDCSSGCPDAQGFYATTFCAATADGGRCLAQCSAGACSSGATCTSEVARPDGSRYADVCIPDTWN